MARKLLLTFLLSLLISDYGLAAITIHDIGGQSTGFSSCSTHTISSISINASATKLIVGCSGTNGTAAQAKCSSMTWNGTSMTKMKELSSTNNTEWPSIWYLDSPATGSHDLVITMAGSDDTCSAGYVSMSGAATGAAEVTQEATGTGTGVSLSITTVANGAYVIDTATHHQYNSDLDYDVSQTEIFGGGGWFQFESSYELKATAGAVTMSHTSGASNTWNTIAVSIAPAAGGGGGRTRRFF